MMLDKDVLSQGFGEQISNLIIGADGENCNVLITRLTKMMIAYIDMLCAMSELGELCTF